MESTPRAGPGKYWAGMLRLWQVTHGGRTVWRASLEDPHTHELKSFADLDSLFAFLKEQTKAKRA